MEHELMTTAIGCAVAELRSKNRGDDALEKAYHRALRVFQFAGYGYSAHELARTACGAAARVSENTPDNT